MSAGLQSSNWSTPASNAETVDGAAERTRQVSCSIAGVSELAEKIGRGADQVVAAAADLNRQTATLTRDAKNFTSRVRAG